MTVGLTFYKSSRPLTSEEYTAIDRCITGYVNADYELRDRLLESGVLQLFEMETEDDEDIAIAAFNAIGWKGWK